MGRIGDRLHGLFKHTFLHFIYHQSHQDRYGKINQQIIKRKQQGILKNIPEYRHVYEPSEMLQSHPGTPGNSQAGAEILKCDLYPIHRPIAENQEKKDTWQQKQVNLIVASYQGKPGMGACPPFRLSFSFLHGWLLSRYSFSFRFSAGTQITVIGPLVKLDQPL